MYYLQQVQKETKLGECALRSCKIVNSHCDSITFKCTCDDGYTSSNDSMRCIKSAVALGQNCEIHDQCFKSDSLSTCINGTCACSGTAAKFEDHCHSIVNDTQLCHSVDDCQLLSLHSECIDSQCVCKRRFVVSVEDNVSWNAIQVDCLTFRIVLGLPSHCPSWRKLQPRCSVS